MAHFYTFLSLVAVDETGLSNMNVRANLSILISAAMEQHRITCEEEGRYVGK